MYFLYISSIAKFNFETFLSKASADVKDHPERYSQIYSPYPVIIAGQRFREFYYW